MIVVSDKHKDGVRQRYYDLDELIRRIQANDEDIVSIDISGIDNNDNEPRHYDKTRALFNALATNEKVTRMDCSCALQHHNFRDIGLMLQQNTSIKKLSLHSNKIGEEETQYLEEALIINHNLEHLDLENNIILIGSSAHFLGRVLSSTQSSLISLNLDLNRLGKDEAIVNLARSLHFNSTLIALSMQGNEIDFEGAIALSEMLLENQTLEHLDVSYNYFGDSGAETIAFALYTNASLKILILSESLVGDHGATALARAFEVNRTLEFVHLDHNLIGADGARAIADAISHSSSPIIHMDLSRNQIDCIGAEALAQALSLNNTLESLDLKSNNISSDGALALSKALGNHNTLRSFDMVDNPTKYYDSTLFVETMKMNKTILYCSVVAGPFKDPFCTDSQPYLIDFYCNLNLWHRKDILQQNFPLSLWPLMLSALTRNQTIPETDLIFYYIRECSSTLFQSECV